MNISKKRVQRGDPQIRPPKQISSCIQQQPTLNRRCGNIVLTSSLNDGSNAILHFQTAPVLVFTRHTVYVFTSANSLKAYRHCNVFTCVCPYTHPAMHPFKIIGEIQYRAINTLRKVIPVPSLGATHDFVYRLQCVPVST